MVAFEKFAFQVYFMQAFRPNTHVTVMRDGYTVSIIKAEARRIGWCTAVHLPINVGCECQRDKRQRECERCDNSHLPKPSRDYCSIHARRGQWLLHTIEIEGPSCAPQQIWLCNVRYGSLAAAAAEICGVRFTPESCRDCHRAARPLRANKRQSAQRNDPDFDFATPSH